MTSDPAHSSPAEYRTTANVPEIVARLTSASSVAVLTHARADGDAVGSTLALSRALAHAGIDARPAFAGAWPARFNAFLAESELAAVPADGSFQPPRTGATDGDLVCIVDTGAWVQLGDAAGWVEAAGPARTVVIDHHPTGDAEIADDRLIDAQAAAAAEIVARLAVALLGAGSASSLPVDVAEPLYLGLASDTGWFRFPNVTPASLRLAADLLDAGVDADRLCQIAEQSDSLARLELTRAALDSLHLVADGRAAVMTLSQADLRDADASIDETSGLTDAARSVAAIRAVALLVEVGPALAKVSMRSKPPMAPGDTDVDVGALAHGMGGGGHRRAAGARLPMALDAATRHVTAVLDAAFAGPA